MLRFRYACSGMAALLLVACGGGGVSIGASTAPPPAGNQQAAFYLPFVATTSTTGQTGLFVIPSNDLASSPIFVTRTAASTQNVNVIAFSRSLTLSTANVVTSTSPYALLYLAVGDDANTHIYGVHLGNIAVSPDATQVSSLSLNSLADVCGIVGTAQTKVSDPASLFVVLQTNAGGSASCGNGGDVYQVVHYSDSSTTAPRVVNITTTATSLVPGETKAANGFTPLYKASGALGGVVLLDTAAENLEFFAGDTFNNPSVLTSGVTSANDMVDDSAGDNNGSVGATTAFLSVMTNGGISSVLRVTSVGTGSAVYTSSGSLSVRGVADKAHVYFTDHDVANGAVKIYQEDIGGGTPLELYEYGVVGNPAAPLTLVGSNGTVLVFTSDTLFSDGGGTTAVMILSVGAKGFPTTISGPWFPQIERESVMMCPSRFADVTSDLLLFNLEHTIDSTYTYMSQALTPDGVTVRQSFLSDSAFMMSPDCAAAAGSVLQVRGITDRTGGYGGGTVNAFSLSSFSATVLNTTTGNGSYVMPTGSSPPSPVFLSDNVGAATVHNASSGADFALAFDLSKNLIVPVSVPNSNVSFPF
jgi:hypothetical protein